MKECLIKFALLAILIHFQPLFTIPATIIISILIVLI